MSMPFSWQFVPFIENTQINWSNDFICCCIPFSCSYQESTVVWKPPIQSDVFTWRAHLFCSIVYQFYFYMLNILYTKGWNTPVKLIWGCNDNGKESIDDIIPKQWTKNDGKWLKTNNEALYKQQLLNEMVWNV